EADLPKMFQRFYRVKNARSRTHEGTGIGLALVQELVKLHGGEVSVQSREGLGTTFTVSIPTGKAHLPADRIDAERHLESTTVGTTPFLQEALRWLPAEAHETLDESGPLNGLGDPVAPGPPGTVPSARILVADDNADMRDYLRRLLAHAYDVVAVDDG